MTTWRTTQRGMTLVELIIAMAIILVTMAGFTLLFYRLWVVNSYTIETGIASLAASRGVSDAVENIRNARQAEDGSFPIVSATDDEFVFYGDYDRDGVVERVRYFVEDELFRVGLIDPDMSQNPPTYNNSESVENIIDFVVNQVEGEATFAYFSDAVSIHEYDDVASSALATPAQVGDVKMVRILLHVNPYPDKAPENAIIQSFVTVRNLSDFDNIAP